MTKHMPAERRTVIAREEAMRAATTPVDPGVESALAHACWLSDDVLFLVVSWAGAGGGQVQAIAHCKGRPIRVVVRGIDYRRPGRDAAESADVSQAVILRLPAGHTRTAAPSIVLRRGNHSFPLEASELKDSAVGLDALLRLELAALGPTERADILALMVAGLVEAPSSTESGPPAAEACCAAPTVEQSRLNALQLSKSLFVARQVLRERLPICVISIDAPQGLSVDAVLAVDDDTFYVQGWLRDEQGVTTRLTAVSPEGSRTELLPRLYRYRRPDVEEFYGDSQDVLPNVEHGWIAHFQISPPSLLTRGWTFEMGNSAGLETEVSAPVATRDITTIRERILHDLLRERLPADRLRAEHIAPALTRLEERRRLLTQVTSIDQHNEPPSDPEITIIVPLYGRIDFMEHQLVQFVHDPELGRADLLYVLDSPELADPFRTLAAHLATLYDVPFRAVVLSHNIGFSGVNNIGTGLARGRLLLLLNSDVFPSQPGWLSAMTSFYDATPDIGALAPKLLYEDDSIQHAGLYFRRLVDTGMWTNEHFFKGLHRSLPAANVPRTVPAVTAACMMIDATTYREIGGLRGMYVQGDYEDSDLCLRLSNMGKENWYLSTVELYHLENQSYPSQMRQLTGDYNRWLHTFLWREKLEQDRSM